VLLELRFESRYIYRDFTVPAVRSSRSPDGLQQTAIDSRSFIYMLYIRIIGGSSLKFNPVSSQL
jgi:hypothetical protein